MKTSLGLIVAATSIFVFTQAADAQCGCQQTESYYAPEATAYYAPTTAYYPSSAYYGGGGYYGSGYYGGSGYNGGYYRGGMFGTGVGGWAGVRGINRRWDRRGW